MDLLINNSSKKEKVGEIYVTEWDTKAGINLKEIPVSLCEKKIEVRLKFRSLASIYQVKDEIEKLIDSLVND